MPGGQALRRCCRHRRHSQSFRPRVQGHRRSKLFPMGAEQQDRVPGIADSGQSETGDYEVRRGGFPEKEREARTHAASPQRSGHITARYPPAVQRTHSVCSCLMLNCSTAVVHVDESPVKNIAGRDSTAAVVDTWIAAQHTFHHMRSLAVQHIHRIRACLVVIHYRTAVGAHVEARFSIASQGFRCKRAGCHSTAAAVCRAAVQRTYHSLRSNDRSAYSQKLCLSDVDLLLYMLKRCFQSPLKDSDTRTVQAVAANHQRLACRARRSAHALHYISQLDIHRPCSVFIQQHTYYGS